jgi:trimeric autotransporter adhesin
VADEVAIKFGADLSGALEAVATLKQALAGIAEPIPRLKTSFAELDAAMQPKAALAALAQFRAQMQQLVSERAISLRQALGFDIEYTAQLNDEERARLETVLAADAATVADKTRAFGQLADLSVRYSAEIARDQQKLADTAGREADRLARPFRQAFAEIGLGWQRAAEGLIEGTLSFRGAALEAARAVERGFVSMTETVISKAAAGPLASLLGASAPRVGEGVADVLGNAASRWIFGAPQQLGEAAASAANTAALTANTAALGALAASLGTTAATAGAGALEATGAGAAAAGSAEGGGVLGFLGGLFAFERGGIVPSAARGWALPNFAGATPALLHAREMVLPAPLSDGLQRMIAEGSGGDMHLHFHGPSDGPAVERWFTGLLARNPGVVRNMLRSNALTPRTL